MPLKIRQAVKKRAPYGALHEGGVIKANYRLYQRATVFSYFVLYTIIQDYVNNNFCCLFL